MASCEAEAKGIEGRIFETAGELRGLAEAAVGDDAAEDEGFRGTRRVFPPRVASSSSSRFTSSSYSGVIPGDWGSLLLCSSDIVAAARSLCFRSTG